MNSADKLLTPPRLELSVVALILALSALAGGGKSSDWLSAIAVLLSFACTQLAFDLSEVECGSPANQRLAKSRYRQLYMVKECFWILTCIMLQNYPLIASTVVFASYPLWRKMVRHQSRQLCFETFEVLH